MTTLTDIETLKGHTCIFWNTRSLYPKLEEIERIVDDSNPHLTSITESWLNSSTSDNQISIDGYNIFWSDRTVESKKRGRGGLIWYCKNEHKLIELTEF